MQGIECYIIGCIILFNGKFVMIIDLTAVFMHVYGKVGFNECTFN